MRSSLVPFPGNNWDDSFLGRRKGIFAREKSWREVEQISGHERDTRKNDELH